MGILFVRNVNPGHRRRSRRAGHVHIEKTCGEAESGVLMLGGAVRLKHSDDILAVNVDAHFLCQHRLITCMPECHTLHFVTDVTSYIALSRPLHYTC